MRQITLNISDSNFPFFMELVEKLGIEIAHQDNLMISEEMKKVLDQRLAEDKSTYTPARESLNKIRAKYGL